MINNEKLWIFQSIRNISKKEQEEILIDINEFLSTWNAHEVPIKAISKIVYDKFLLVIADENYTKASGCSMDKLNGKIREIDSKYDLSLLNRFLTSYEVDNNIHTEHLSVFKNKVKNKEIKEDAIVYNISIDKTEIFDDNFRKPIKESWAKIYLN